MKVFQKKALPLLFFFCPGCVCAISQNDALKNLSVGGNFGAGIDTAQNNYLTLKKINNHKTVTLNNWKYFSPIDVKSAEIDLNKSIKLDSDFLLNEKGETKFKGGGWFWTIIFIDSSLQDEPLCMFIQQQGACAIYVDDVCIRKLGIIQKGTKADINYNPGDIPMGFPVSPGAHILKIKYSNKNYLEHFVRYQVSKAGFKMKIASGKFAFESYFYANLYFSLFIFGLSMFFLCSAFIHLLLYLFYRKQVSNFHYAVYAILLGLLFAAGAAQHNATNPEFTLWCGRIIFYLIPLSFLVLMWMLLNLYGTNKNKFLRLATVVLLSLFLLQRFAYQISGLLLFCYVVGCVVISIVYVISAIKHKKQGAWIIGIGTLFFLLFIGIILVGNMFGKFFQINLSLNSTAAAVVILLVTLAVISIPVSMSVYLAKGFSTTNLHLEAQIIQVEKLSALTIAQEKEKQKMLESQKENLEIQVKERTREVMEQKEILEEQNKNIIDSINYAKRIQQSILPNEKMINKIFKRLRK